MILTLKVGDTVRLETDEGVKGFTVWALGGDSSPGPGWMSTSPSAGQVTLHLKEEG